jgi:hypothetical protein
MAMNGDRKSGSGIVALALALALPGLGLSCASVEVEARDPGGGDGRVDPSIAGGRGGSAAGRGGAGGGFSFVVPDAAPPGSGGAGDPLGEGRACNKLDVKFDKQIPTVAVLVDRSSSMFDRYDGTGNRWDVLKKALLDPQAGLIKQNEKDVRFGLFLYTSTSQAPTCPALGTVTFALGNHAEIDKLYGPAQPPSAREKGETPTGESVAAVLEALQAVKEPGPKHIVLATDGEPDTCPGTCTGNCPVPERMGWPRDPNCGQDKSIAAVQAAFKAGVKTHVLALGNDVGAEHLQSLANAGAGLPVALGGQANWLQQSCGLPRNRWQGSYVDTAAERAKFFRPADAATLAADLKAILSDVRTCTFTLEGKVDPPNAPRGTVVLDGEPLKHGDPDGWRLNGQSELELLGKACAKLKGGADRLQVGFPCGVYIIE